MGVEAIMENSISWKLAYGYGQKLKSDHSFSIAAR